MPLLPTDSLTSEILISAPPARVWSILTDGAAYPDWNPFIRRLDGPIRPGARIVTVMQPKGKRPMRFRPRILHVDPGRLLVWQGRLILPGLLDAEHSFRLIPEGAATRLIHAETFRGLAMLALRAETFRPDFEAMNAALKARSEG